MMPPPANARGRQQRGQALIEFGIILFAFIFLSLCGIGIAMLNVAVTAVDGAVQMAVLGAGSVPADDGAGGYAAANAAWTGTVGHHPWLIANPLPQSCAGPRNTAIGGGYDPGDVITCTGSARLNLGGTIVGMLWVFPDPVITATARYQTSPFRSS